MELRTTRVYDQDDNEMTCSWFALCDRPATHVREHPAFPSGVPTCDRCGNLVDKAS